MDFGNTIGDESLKAFCFVLYVSFFMYCNDVIELDQKKV